jgi:DNA invertase Pin-like site-specific DNA recombinase
MKFPVALSTPFSTRAALYARVSTREGRQHLENQLGELREYASVMNWTVTKEYTDQESGASDRRPGLDALMKDAARRRFDLVAVFDLSRLTRGGPAKAFGYIARLSAARVEFWSITEEMFRTAGPLGEVFIALAAHVAAQERAAIQNRIRAGIDAARKRGQHLGRNPKILDREKIRTLAHRGQSRRQIARALGCSAATIHRRLRELT